jgi:Tol biopolymer transport system component
VTDAATRLSAALADRYVIERELGAGGMATVYLAHDVRHDRKVALKVLRPELSAILGGERFLAEIKTTANLQHPHILSLFDSGIVGSGDRGVEFLYYVMPYVEGESLRERLSREKQLPVDEAVRIAREVADALQYAHEHGIVHRDIKPENILLHGGHAMVADFGIALAASRSEGGSRMTETGMSLGTPHYMSPEQAMGEREITPKADIYALGCVLYEMLTGEPPFTGPTAQAIIARVMTEEPRSLTLQRRTIPPHIEAVVRRALEKLPADRFASAAQFAESLDKVDLAPPATRAAGATAPPAVSWRDRARTIARLVPWLIGAAALGSLVTWALTPVPGSAPVARFALPLPGTAAVSGFTPTISPDGSRLVFMGLDSARIARLYLRSMDREAPVEIPGTENVVNSAYFSPDGEWIVFRQGTRVRKVNLAGGAAQPICEAVGGLSGMSWGSRNVIAIAIGDSLYRVSSAGGQPELLLGPDSAAGVIRFSSPSFLPDGRTLLLVRHTANRVDIVALNMDTRRVTPLDITGITPMYVDGGRLVFADPSGTLLTVRFDPRRLRVTGEPEPIAENLNVNLGIFARYSVSRTGAIVYYSGTAVERRELILVDREGRVQPLRVQLAPYRYPRFSPDGRRIAVGIESGTRSLWGDIWEFNLSSQRLTRLTFDESGSQPEWTPDGLALTYSRLTTMPEVYRVAADGSSDPRPLFNRNPNRIFEARLLPDGRHLVFREDVNARDVLVAPIDSPQAARPLAATSFNERAFAVSPDGRWIAFTSNQSGTNEVYVRRIEEGSPRWQVSTRGGTEPRWGPLARELFFRIGDSVYVVTAQLGADARFSEPRVLFGGNYHSSVNDVLWDVSPDGRRFVMVRLTGGAQSTNLHLILNLFGARAGREAEESRR